MSEPTKIDLPDGVHEFVYRTAANDRQYRWWIFDKNTHVCKLTSHCAKHMIDTAIALAERKYHKRTCVHRNTPINFHK